jgi:hypothetical protein
MKWVKTHASILTLISGSIIMSMWTLFRFFTKPIIFDLVGQQVLAQQWFNGFTGGSITAPTNYIFKIFFIYMPLHALNIPPHIALIAMTLFINIATFVCLFFVTKKLLQILKIPVSGFFYLAMLWLASAAGAIFWIQFANSRNLEVAAGVLLLYLGLKFIEKPSRVLAATITVFSGLLFFADPLQLYTTGLVIVIFVGTLFLSHKLSLKRASILVTSIILGFIFSLLINVLVRHVFELSFNQVSSVSQSLAVLSHPLKVVEQTTLANVRFVANTYDIGRLSQLINGLLLAVSILASIWLIVKRKLAKRTVLFIGIAFITIELVYIASGQVLSDGDTSRYLIMLAPVIVIMISLLTFLPARIKSLVKIIFIIGLFINITLLAHATLSSRTNTLNVNIKQSTYDYLKAHDISYAYASMDTAIPATYLYPTEPSILPLSCSDGTLLQATTFYDKAAYSHVQSQISGEVALIFDGQVITNAPQVCTVAQAVSQFGAPEQMTSTSDSNTIMLFSNPIAVADHIH